MSNYSLENPKLQKLCTVFAEWQESYEQSKEEDFENAEITEELFQVDCICPDFHFNVNVFLFSEHRCVGI